MAAGSRSQRQAAGGYTGVRAVQVMSSNAINDTFEKHSLWD